MDFREYRILGACNPPFAYQALQAEDKIGIMLPCNVIVQETGEGKIEVAAVDPIASMLAIQNPGLGEIAVQVIVWSGQYEYMQRAQQRLKLVVPITLLIIFLLLYFNFKNITESLIIMLSLPFALVGGIWLMWLSGYNMSVAVGVGFIALAGVAAETGVVMLLYIDNAYKDRLLQGTMNTRGDLHAAVVHGAVERVRPKLMTVSTTIMGLLPIMWGHGTGSQVMKRIAAPMVGGLITSTILTLIVIPAIYFLWRGRNLKPEQLEKNKV